MDYSIPYNRFFQANFSKAKILIDFFIRKENSDIYDEYVRQGIEDLIQNLNSEKYSTFLNNMDGVLSIINVNDSDFTNISIIIMFLVTDILSEGRGFLSKPLIGKFRRETKN